MKQLRKWLVEDKVIFTCIIGELNVTDFPDLDANIISLLEASPYDHIHILTDISMMTTMPNILQMSKLKYITHPKMGFFITQGRNPIEQFIGQTVGQMLKTKYKFVNTLEEGIEFLSNIDNLPPVSEMQERVHIIRSEFINNNPI